MNKALLFTSFLSFFITMQADVSTSSHDVFTFTYTVSADDESNLTDFKNAYKQFKHIINSIEDEQATRDAQTNSSMFTTLLNFIQQIQTAISSGMNLFATAQTSDATASDDVVVAAEVVATVIEEDQTTTASTDTTDTTDTTKRLLGNASGQISGTKRNLESELENVAEEAIDAITITISSTSSNAQFVSLLQALATAINSANPTTLETVIADLVNLVNTVESSNTTGQTATNNTTTAS